MNKSELIPEMCFSSKQKAKQFDNIITKILNNKNTKQLFGSIKYASHYAALRAIEMNEFHFQLLNLNDEDFNELISLCEEVEDILDGNVEEDCYKIPLNFLYLKIYDLENYVLEF
jgi:hypothetical protein